MSQAHMSPDAAVVLFGPTQAGKSTTFNWLTDMGQAEGVAAATGDGSGESVTVEPKLRKSKIGLLLDTPGINDTKMRFTNDEAGKKIAIHVYGASLKRIKIIVFEGLNNDAIQLRHTVAALMESLGPAVLKSVVVLATKADDCKASKKAVRVPAIENMAQELGVGEVLEWQNEDLDEEGQAVQLANLRAALLRVPAISTADLEDLDERVARRAQELCEQAAPRRETVKTEVQEQYTEERTEVEEFDEPYQTWETGMRMVPYAACVPRTKTVKVPYVDTETRTVGWEMRQQREWSSFRREFRWVDRRMPVKERREVVKYREEDETHNEVEIREREETYQYPVISTRRACRPKTVFDKKTRMVEVEVEVVVPRKVEEFMAQAREDVIAEVRVALRHA